jgi:hypothetical protein
MPIDEESHPRELVSHMSIYLALLLQPDYLTLLYSLLAVLLSTWQ